MKINFEELKKDMEENRKERLAFVKYWADFVRNNPDEVWSEMQNNVIDSQIK